MAAYEIYYYGKKPLYFVYKGESVSFQKNRTYRTDDDELAKVASEQQLVEVIKVTKPLSEMSKKELLAKAADRDIPRTTGLNKGKLIELIQTA